jgi:transcriptional regulator with XRE-family HTH domain
MNRGPDVSATLPGLARSKGFSQRQLEEATGIGHSTMSRYWSGRGGLGEKNARRIANALGVNISDLGLPDEGAEVGVSSFARRLEELATAVATLSLKVDTGFELLAHRVADLEKQAAHRADRAPATSRRRRRAG